MKTAIVTDKATNQFPHVAARTLAATAALGAFVLSSAGALAQVAVSNPSKVAPNSFQPAPKEGARIAVPAGGGLQAPAGAGKTIVSVQRVHVEGGFPEFEAQTAAIAAQVEHRRVSVDQIYDVAKSLQAAYAGAGYPLVRVVVPAQKFASGSVRIVVIDGFVEAIDVSGVPERSRGIVRGRLEPLLNKGHMTLGEIQRRLLLVGEISGLSASNTTKDGSGPGRAVLSITGTEKLVSGSTSVDNRLSRYLGSWEFTQQASINNALGFGEQVYAGVASSKDVGYFFDGQSKYQAYGAGVTLPIGFDGLSLSAGYIASRTNYDPIPGTFPVTEPLGILERASGQFSRTYVRANYPLILQLDHALRVQASYEFITDRLRQGPIPAGFALPVGWVFDLNRDRYSVSRFALEDNFLLPWSWGGKATLTGIYSHGLGGRSQWDSPVFVDTPLSRPGARPNFDKLNVEARIYQPLPEQFQLTLIGKAQTNFGKPQLNPEQLSLDGLDALSGYAAGALSVDRGALGRAELSRLFPVNLDFLRANVTPYVFGAFGRGVVDWPFINEQRSRRAASFGGGVRTNSAITGAPFGESINVEFARDTSNIPFQQTGYRVNFSMVVRY